MSRNEIMPDLRSMPVDNYLIFYLTIEGIEIVRVFAWHAGYRRPFLVRFGNLRDKSTFRSLIGKPSLVGLKKKLHLKLAELNGLRKLVSLMI